MVATLFSNVIGLLAVCRLFGLLTSVLYKGYC
jgi:hypothetical protein